MSFFDEDDEPTRTKPRPRRASPPPRAAGAPDPQTARVRQAMLIGLFLVFLFLLFIALKGCASSRHKTALKDYNREHSQLISDSDSEVAQPFFDLLSKVTADSANDLASQIQSLRVQADQELRQAAKLTVPDEMAAAQRSFLITLEMRRNALQFIGDKLPVALADDADAANQAIAAIAGQFEVLLASDVIHETRVVPFIKHALDKAEVGGQTITRSSFMGKKEVNPAGLAWLDPDFVGTHLNPNAGTGSRRTAQSCPSLCGTGIDGVTVGATDLKVGTVVNRIPGKAGTQFVVKFTNGGDVDEFDVKVTITITPESGKAIKLSRTIDQVAAKKQAEASISLTKAAPTGVASSISVAIAPVPGEKKLDNNKATYTALFQ
jgi:hypothetical protein